MRVAVCSVACIELPVSHRAIWTGRNGRAVPIRTICARSIGLSHGQADGSSETPRNVASDHGVDRGDWSVAQAAAFSFARRRWWRLGRASGVVGSTGHVEVA